MTADPPVLDLDSPGDADAAQPSRVRLRDLRVPLWVVGLVAVVVAVASVGLTRLADSERARRSELAAVRVVVSVPAGAGLSGGGDSASASFVGTLQVVNAGPLPIQIDGVNSLPSSGIRVTRVNRVTRDARDQAIQPGETREIDVGVGLVCRRWGHGQPIELTADLVTVDGKHHLRRNSLDVRGTAWFAALAAACPSDF